MGFIPTITCRRCHRKYSGIRSRCPHCGTKKMSASGRVPASAASTDPDTYAGARADENAKWQLIFGGILLGAVILAVIVLILTSIGGKQKPEPTPSPTMTPIATVKPTMTPTPTVPVEITSLEILVDKYPSTGWTGKVGESHDHKVEYFPADAEVDVEWSVSDEKVIKISGEGKEVKVTCVAPGSAEITAKIGDKQEKMTIIVKSA